MGRVIHSLKSSTPQIIVSNSSLFDKFPKIMPPKTSKVKAPAKAATEKERSPSPDLTQPKTPEAGDRPQSKRGRPKGVLAKKKNKVNDRQYKRYVGIVLRQVHPEMTMSKAANDIMNSFLHDTFERIADEAGRLSHNPCYKRKHSRIDARDVQTAVRLLLPGELSKHAISEGTKAVTKYYAPVDK